MIMVQGYNSWVPREAQRSLISSHSFLLPAPARISFGRLCVKIVSCLVFQLFAWNLVPEDPRRINVFEEKADVGGLVDSKIWGRHNMRADFILGGCGTPWDRWWGGTLSKGRGDAKSQNPCIVTPRSYDFKRSDTSSLYCRNVAELPSVAMSCGSKA